MNISQNSNLVCTLQLSSNPETDPHVIALVGKLTAGNHRSDLLGLVTEALSKPGKHLQLDMSSVTYIDSKGIQTLCDIQSLVNNSGQALVLYNLTEKVRGLLQITKVLDSFIVEDKAQVVV